MAIHMKSKLLQLLKNKTAHILFLLFVLAFVWHSGFKTYYNYGESMEPTLKSHQLIVVNKIWYDLVPLARYDVVVINVDDDECYTKRVIALPNEVIEIRNGRIFVNGKERADDPIKNPWHWYNSKTGVGNRGIKFPKTLLKANECFYIGDNRDETVWGIASMKDIRGKVMMLK